MNLCGLLLGDNVEGIAKELGGYGADEVIVCEHPLLKNYTTDAYAKVICDVISEMKPEAFLIGATNIGRDLGPRCAARLHTGLCADCTHLDVDMPIYKDFLRSASTLPEEKIEKMNTAKVMGQDHDVSRDLKMTRPAFGGNLMATIICPRFRPAMATVRPGVMKKAPFDQAKADAVKITKPSFTLSEADMDTEVVEVVKAAKKLVDLIGADYIVSVGRGISKDVEGGIKLAEELADVLGGVVGGSRVAIDSGWLTADHQVGQTGKTVHPKVYIALGISGSIQHKAGMSESECIIAVNKNETRSHLRDRRLRHLRRPVQGHPRCSSRRSRLPRPRSKEKFPKRKARASRLSFFCRFCRAAFCFCRKYYRWVLHGKRQGEKNDEAKFCDPCRDRAAALFPSPPAAGIRTTARRTEMSTVRKNGTTSGMTGKTDSGSNVGGELKTDPATGTRYTGRENDSVVRYGNGYGNTSADKRAGTKNATANSTLHGSYNNPTGTPAGQTAASARGMSNELRYRLMLENARVHDTDGFLLDGENAHYNTFR